MADKYIKDLTETTTDLATGDMFVVEKTDNSGTKITRLSNLWNSIYHKFVKSNLTTTEEGYVLDARQGKILKDSKAENDLHSCAPILTDYYGPSGSITSFDDIEYAFSLATLTLSNPPWSGNGFAYVTTMQYSTNANRVQIACGYNTNKMAIRRKNNNTWSNWTLLGPTTTEVVLSGNSSINISFTDYNLGAYISSANSSGAFAYAFSLGYLKPIKEVSSITAALSSDYKTITLTNTASSRVYIEIVCQQMDKITIN